MTRTQRTQLLSTAAAAALLLLGAGAATAGDIHGPVKPERAPAAQQNAPAEKIAPTMQAGHGHGAVETTGQGAINGSAPSPRPGTGADGKLDAHGSVGATPPQGTDTTTSR